MKCGARVSHLPSPGPTDPLVGVLNRALGASYEIVRLLGRGGMGAVYLARERALDRLVAIKVLPPEATDVESIQRFRREARTTAKLSHPNIVPLYTFGEAEGTMYFVMGFVQGEPLSAKLRRRGRMEPDEARELLGQLAGALHYAHTQGVVHRDIKPDNILVEDESGRPMLTDFGVAKSVNMERTLTELGTTLGTPHYMSPEQAAGEREIDGRSDIYSLGVVAYEMLTGRRPFEGASAREVMTQHIVKEPAPVGAATPSVPDDLAEVVSRLLAKDPDRRMPDGRSLESALRAGAEGDAWLPQELEDLVDEVKPIPWLAGGALYVSYGMALWGNWEGAVASAAVGGLLALLPWAQRRGRKLEQYSWRTILSRVLTKPRWWMSWWPNRFRRKDDLWDRLPEPLRQFRAAYGPAIGGFLLALPVFLRAGWGSASIWWLQTAMPLAMVPGLGAAGVLAWRGYRLYRWGRKQGLTAGEISKLAEADDAALIWKREHIRKLLLAAGGALPEPLAPAPSTPAEQVEALIQAARTLDGPAQSVARDAAAAGREVLSAIQVLDRQIEALARDADSAEQARLEQKLAALAASGGEQTEARQRMRRLVEEQLDLARSLTRQLDGAQEQRSYLADLLKTLWLQMANLRAHHQESSFDAGDISGRIRAVAEDARRYLEASEQVRGLLEDPSAIGRAHST
ncbi:MAG TPA: protein kinase [Gemmatimonadales bacterium]